MADIVELKTSGDRAIAITVAPTDSDESSSRGGFGPDDKFTEKVTESFDDALDGLRDIADSLHRTLSTVAHAPDVVTVNFGINFSASAGLIIAQGSGGANLQISMQWQRDA